MKYGYFDDSQREYVITRPDTPKPWINYLGVDSFFGIISNTGGGYCFYRDAKLRRLTRYRYNNIPLDSNGRYFYIKDQASGEYWSATWQPVRKELDKYECRHGLGYTKIAASYSSIETEVLYTVPKGETLELHQVKITNSGNTVRQLSLFSFVEFCLWDASEDDRNFQRNLNIGEVEVEGSTIYHKTEYRERRNHYAYYHVNEAATAYTTDRFAFTGTYGSLEKPEAVETGELDKQIASGWSPVASHQIDVTLEPGESKTLVFVLGYAENEPEKKWQSPGIINKEVAHSSIKRFSTPESVEQAMAEIQSEWNKLLAPYLIKSGDERLDRMVNIWNPYQCMVTFNMSRSASYYESGVGRGMGFRDSNQDLLGFVHQVPERARERIIDIASTQLLDGGAYHQYQPLTKRGNADIGGNFNDDPLWLILGVGGYIRETGDIEILDEKVDFENESSLAAPLLDHLDRSFTFTLNNLGPHGLPLIGRADWNDCLNLNCFSSEPGESFQTTANQEGRTAESLMIAGLFVYAAKEYAEILRTLGKEDKAESVDAAAAKMVETIDVHGREPEWFLRAYDYFGNKVGSPECEDGKIYIESQGWCVMAGCGHQDGFARKALDATEKHLGTAHGLVLQHPPYADYHLNLGEVSSYPPGYKENGGIFCHNNPWIMIAEAMLGNGEKAYDYYKRIAPAFREDVSEVHGQEPYVYAQMIAGKAAARHGEAKNSWLTGTAAWNYVAITQHILGIRPGYEGLIIDPSLPADMGKVQIERVFRGCTYKITLQPAASGASPSIIVDGEVTHSNVITPQPEKTLSVLATY
ncbi:cellobiose phosphorylase [Rubritalea squalenifaciens DSM 18772]|uniref:Cellobiose phosphorylase n=1 Tax=Rubritalea squalenifaciens DSM 18772 TaxID=1123071 RepID=A0A1M6ISP8_9BACT|nr:glycosyl transferase [Rubritalea squalenifaciens]SHJ37359.1 cellobiose phosphorylase [Rubritalea squalenifaciens DSM 18772]